MYGKSKGKSKTMLASFILSALLLLASTTFFKLGNSYADLSSNADVKGNIGTSLKNLVGGNSNESSSVNANVSTLAGGSNASASASASQQSSYKSSYGKRDGGEFVVATDHRLYKPGENVNIQGDVSSQLRSSLQIIQVMLEVRDNSNDTVDTKATQVNSDGSYKTSIALPHEAKQGAFTIQASLQVKTDVLSALSAEVKAQLQTSNKFVVISPNAFAVKANVNGQEKSYPIQIASNSTVSNVSLDVSQKKLTFTVEGQSGTHGVTQITIPKEMLGGNLQVLIDGVAVSDSDVIVAGDNSTETTLELNYHHSTHEVTIEGTNVVPEFPISTVLLTTGIVGAIVVIASRAGHIWNRGSIP